ncbi:MAG: OsmC family protein [Bryobacterales bacterium]|nr:OsmC family protein [Bryobacteraceae bacterium]MDW8130682.1 OsmC family protein [Bryobacterales bacterium]
MGVVIEGRYLGRKKIRLVHEPSGAELLTDAPRDNYGEASSFSPTDLVAGALGACMMTIIGILAEREGLDVSGMHMRVEKHMQPEPRRIARLELVLHLPAALSAEDRRRLESAARSCPVSRCLHPDIAVEHRFLYDV